MSWSGLANNQLVSFSNLRDAVYYGVFDGKVDYTSIPNTNEIVTKQNVQDYVWIDEGNPTWSGYTSLRCPPKSAFAAGKYCTLVSISISDIISSTGNTSYPDGTVYVRTADGTFSYTSDGQYDLCTRPTADYPQSEWIYYYAYDSIQYFTVSTLNFYPSNISCNTVGCTPSSYSVLYDASSCPCFSGTSTTIYVSTTPTWTVGTRISANNKNTSNVATGYYSYAGKCYYVSLVGTDLNFCNVSIGGSCQSNIYYTSQVTIVANC